MLLDEIVSRGRGTPPSSYHESTNGQNGTVHEMMIPAGKAGLVIGKGGETIKQLQVHCMIIECFRTEIILTMCGDRKDSSTKCIFKNFSYMYEKVS